MRPTLGEMIIVRTGVGCEGGCRDDCISEREREEWRGEEPGSRVPRQASSPEAKGKILDAGPAVLFWQDHPPASVHGPQ